MIKKYEIYFGGGVLFLIGDDKKCALYYFESGEEGDMFEEGEYNCGVDDKIKEYIEEYEVIKID